MRDRPGCQGCWYPERRKEMDAAVASETRITAAKIPCSGAFTSGADAAQGSSSGGRICSYTCCGFAAPRMSHMAKKGGHFPVQFSRSPYWRGTEIEAGNRSPFFQAHHIFENTRLADATQRLHHYGAGAITCKPAPHRDALWRSSTSMRPM